METLPSARCSVICVLAFIRTRMIRKSGYFASVFELRPVSRCHDSPLTTPHSHEHVGKSKSPRKKMVLPVKLSMGDDNHLAHTLDISHTGARLGALRTQLQPGTVVSLRRGSKKADFRITLGSTARRHRSTGRR